MTVLDCLKPLTRSAVGNDDRLLQNKFFAVCKCPGGRDTINCQMPVPRHSSVVQQMPGGILAAGIDSHISTVEPALRPPGLIERPPHF